jgi:hypothetical protein
MLAGLMFSSAVSNVAHFLAGPALLHVLAGLVVSSAYSYAASINFSWLVSLACVILAVLEFSLAVYLAVSLSTWPALLYLLAVLGFNSAVS